MRRPLRSFLPGWLARRDLQLFRAVAEAESPALDRLLPRLSRAADHSRLWMATALVLALAGGRFGRRAALRGLLATAAASATVNLPMKLATRRKRPPIELVPQIRRLRRLPTSSSLPSGHSASAAAFATGVALELPPAAGPVGLLAAGVALSRVYTGVHYPADIVLGAGIGAGFAVASTRWWPLAAPGSRTRPLELHDAAVEASPDGQGVVICVNADAGAAWAPGRSGAAQLGLNSDPAAAIGSGLPAAEVRELASGDLVAGLEQAAEGAAILGVAGGDGSVNAAAEIAHRRGLPLLVLPHGTHNHLARDLGVAAWRDAVSAVRGGEAVAVDLATIADRPFLNAASLGGYAALVDARERLEGRIGKWPALLWGLLEVLRRGEPIRAEVDGRPRTLWMLFAGNCRYHPDGFAPAWRERLDDGLLDVRVVDADMPWARTRLVASVLAGRLGRSRAYREWAARSVRVRSLDGPLRLVRDGETFDGPEAFEIRKEAQPLTVFAPRSR